MKRIGYIDGRRIFLADGQALSFGTDKDIAFSFAAGRISITGGDLQLATLMSKLYLSGTDCYISGRAGSQLEFKATSTDSWAIYFTVGSGGAVNMDNAYLVLRKTAVDSIHEAALWYDTSEDTLKYKAAAYVCTLIRSADGWVYIPATDDLLIAGAKRLVFRTPDSAISSIGPGQLEIKVANNADWALILQTGVGGCVRIHNAYLLLYSTTTIGAINGQLWYNATAHEIRAWVGNQQVRLSTTAV